MHRLHNYVTCNMSQTYKYRNHPRSLLSHASFLSQMVPLDSPCSHESGDILFVQKKVLLWCQNIFYKVLSIFLVYHVPGTMPSLPIFPYLDSTHKNESNCVYYMVVSNQHLSTKISFSQYVFKCSFFNFGYLFKYLVSVLTFHVNAFYF